MPRARIGGPPPRPAAATTVERLVLTLFLALFALAHAVEWGLLLLDARRVARGTGAPPPRAAPADPARAARTRDYALARSRLALARSAFGAGFTLALLLSGALPLLDGALGALGLTGAHRFVAFLVALWLVSGLAGLPFSLLSTFGVEARFGFNRTTPALWLRDRAKGLLLAAALGLPLLYAAHAFFGRAGEAWWLWLFGLLALLQLVLSWAGPALIAPLFNRYTPLPPGPLRQRLEALCRDTGFRTRGLFVVDGSRRSGHSNAYFTGLWRPRIVLFDTLVARSPPEELAAVLAHEIGHYLRRHVWKGLLLGLLGQALSLWLLSGLAAWPPAFRAFGFDGPSLHAALALASLAGGAFTFWLGPAAAWLSRRHEREADRFAAQVAGLGPALAAALVRLGEENLSVPDPHPWYAAWHHGHPTLAERVAALSPQR